jgi:homoserine dehydrogenase
VMVDLTRILAEAGISIDAVLQKEPGEKARTDIIIITHQTREKYVNAAIDRIEQLSAVVGKVVRIRLESLS